MKIKQLIHDIQTKETKIIECEIDDTILKPFFPKSSVIDIQLINKKLNKLIKVLKNKKLIDNKDLLDI